MLVLDIDKLSFQDTPERILTYIEFSNKNSWLSTPGGIDSISEYLAYQSLPNGNPHSGPWTYSILHTQR